VAATAAAVWHSSQTTPRRMTTVNTTYAAQMENEQANFDKHIKR